VPRKPPADASGWTNLQEPSWEFAGRCESVGETGSPSLSQRAERQSSPGTSVPYYGFPEVRHEWSRGLVRLYWSVRKRGCTVLLPLFLLEFVSAFGVLIDDRCRDRSQSQVGRLLFVQRRLKKAGRIT